MHDLVRIPLRWLVFVPLCTLHLWLGEGLLWLIDKVDPVPH